MKVKMNPKTQILRKVKVFKILKMIAATTDICTKYISVEESVLVILPRKDIIKKID